MSNTFARLAAFAVLLVAVFTGAALLGSATDPSGSSADEGHGGQAAGEHGMTEPAASATETRNRG